MALNDVDTKGKYCPFCGFEPPCGLCMFAVESKYGFVACAISVMAVDDNGFYIKNVLNDSNYKEQK